MSVVIRVDQTKMILVGKHHPPNGSPTVTTAQSFLVAARCWNKQFDIPHATLGKAAATVAAKMACVRESYPSYIFTHRGWIGDIIKTIGEKNAPPEMTMDIAHKKRNKEFVAVNTCRAGRIIILAWQTRQETTERLSIQELSLGDEPSSMVVLVCRCQSSSEMLRMRREGCYLGPLAYRSSVSTSKNGGPDDTSLSCWKKAGQRSDHPPHTHKNHNEWVRREKVWSNEDFAVHDSNHHAVKADEQPERFLG